MNTNEVTSRLDRIIELLEALTAANQIPAPAASSQAHHNLPTFQGYPCAWTRDARGFPSYIVDPDGEIAEKRTSNDDVWYSTKTGDDYGPHLAKVRAGETLPDNAQWQPPRTQAQTPTAARSAPPDAENGPDSRRSGAPDGPKAAQTAPVDAEPASHRRPDGPQQQAAANAQAAAAQPQASPPDDDNPFSTLAAPTLRRLHALGRAVHGEAWREIGPERVTAHSDGRAERSDQLSHDEAIRLINELQAAIGKDTPEYAG